VSTLQGVYAAAVMPRQAGTNKIEMGAAFDLIDYLSKSGVQGIALFGSTGEFLHFDLEDRLRLLRLGTKRSEVPVIAGVGHSTLDGAVRLAEEAADAGAAAVILMPPYFFRYGQEEIRAFYLEFAEELAGCVPIMLYNIAAFSNELEYETGAALLTTGLFAGIKDSTSNLDDFMRWQSLRASHSFTLLVGNDVLFTAARSGGADGVVSGVACAVPELLLGLDRAIQSNNTRKRDQLESRLREFLERADSFPAPVGVRAAVEVRGLKTGPHAVPFGAEGQSRLDEFREWFRAWLPAVREECRHE
jgi:4-hydroxy-tetrahydrodipicolinate synthase